MVGFLIASSRTALPLPRLISDYLCEEPPYQVILCRLRPGALAARQIVFLSATLQLAYSLAMLTSDAGVQGSIAGFPCDVLIVDHPYKDHLEAHSG